MSADTVDQNAQATEEAKNLLAELESEAPVAAEKNGEAEGTKEPEAATDTKEEKEESGDKPARTERGERRERRNDGRRNDRGGRGGRGGFKNYRDNVKSVLTEQEKSSDPEAIRKQVDFYFSDSNLYQDKFLLNKVGGSENNPVELSVIHSFKRMRHFEPLEAIVEALKESKIVRLTDDNTKVQRIEPLPEGIDYTRDDAVAKVHVDKSMAKSVYVKGFGDEKPSTQFDIEAFFSPYGPTNAVRLRRADDKLFKGSVFVEFETEELAQKFLELDPKPTWNDKPLQIMSKKEYCEKKVDDINSGRIRPNERTRGGRGGSRGGPRGRGARGGRGGRGGRDDRPRRDRDDRDWRERREEDRKNGFKQPKEVEKDERGIPVVKAGAQEKEDALAKARAAVASEDSKKREREDDGAQEEPAAKKVDAKSETA